MQQRLGADTAMNFLPLPSPTFLPHTLTTVVTPKLDKTTNITMQANTSINQKSIFFANASTRILTLKRNKKENRKCLNRPLKI
jgi:hypothetical protein